jgi:hypothetical protein
MRLLSGNVGRPRTITWRGREVRSAIWKDPGLVLPELTGIGATPAARASLASLLKRWAPAISTDELGRRERPETRLGEQARRDPGDEVGELGLERVDGDGQLAQAAQLVAGDPNAHRLLSAREAPGDLRRPFP